MTAALVWTGCFAFVFSLLLTPLARNLFLRYGILDRPDGHRKVHTSAIPRVGGVPIALSYMAAYSFFLGLNSGSSSALEQRLPFVITLLPAALCVFLTGLVDDIRGLSPKAKIAGQLLGAVAAVAAGVRISTIGGWPLGPGLAELLTVVWLVGCTNAFNLIDGLDGLASGMGLFATLTMFVAALLSNDTSLALATLPLAGSLLGFLRYNFNPASVFLGDSGSLLIGFLLGCYGVIWSQKSATILGMTAPMMALAIPLADALLAIARRWLRGQPIFGADRNHIHHRLLDRGLTHRRVVLLLYLVCGVYAGLSLLTSFGGTRFGGVVLVVFCAVTWAGVQSLGYAEFGAAGRILRGSALRGAVNGQISLQALERAVSSARNLEECWRMVDHAGREFGFISLRARLNGEVFARHDDLHDPDECWRLQIPLPGGDYVSFARPVGSIQNTVVTGPLVETIHRLLARRLAELRPPAPAQLPARARETVPTRVDSLLGMARELTPPVTERHAVTSETRTAD